MMISTFQKIVQKYQNEKYVLFEQCQLYLHISILFIFLPLYK